MKRLISAILALAIILSLGATVSAKMGENSTNMNTFKPTSDPIYWYEQPRNEDGSYDYFGYPLYGDPQDVPDEEFFGKWDEYENKWINIPYFKYSEYPAMAKVEEATKAGDYETAKEELLAYYRVYGEQRIEHTMSTPYDYNFLYLDDVARNTFPTVANGRTAGIVEITNEWKWHSHDVTNTFALAVSQSNLSYSVMISSIDKYWTQALIATKESEYVPYISTTVNGVPVTIKCTMDGVTTAGSLSSTVITDGEYLRIEEHGKYQDYDENTSCGYLAFSLDGIESNAKIGKSMLNFYAKTDCELDPSRAPERKELNLYWNKDTTWTEDNLSWDYFTERLWFSTNDCEFWDFITPSGANLKGKVMDYHRGNISSRICSLWDFYDDERAAYQWMRMELGLVNSIGLEPDVMNALDRSTHTINCTLQLLQMMDNPYMTPERFTALLKFYWQLADYQTEFYFGGTSTNNWATYGTSSVYSVCARFPEFRKYEYWMEEVRKENERCFGSNTYPDGSCAEQPLGYVGTILNTFETPLEIANVTGCEVPFTDKMIEDMHNMILTQVYAKGPYGGFHYADVGDAYSSHTSTMKTWYQLLFNDDEILQYFITDGIAGKAPENPTTSYHAAKKTFMRSGWGKNDLMLSFVNVSSKPSSHNHKDALSIAMFAYGKFLLTDQGYGGVLTGDLRKYYISPVQHNTVTVNDNEKYLIEGTTNSEATLLYNKNPYEGDYEHDYESNDFYDYVEYGNSNYTTSKYIQRSVTFLKAQKFYVVTDYAIPTDDSEGVDNLFAQHWHMFPESGMNNNETLQVRSNFPDVNVKVIPVEYEEIDELEYVDTQYSPGSNTHLKSKKAVYLKTHDGAGRFTTVIIPMNTGEDFDVETSVIETELDKDLVNTAYFRITNKKTNDVNYYYYYHINEVDKKPEDGLKIGEFTTDATTMIVQKNAKEEIVSTFLLGATFLKSDKVDTDYLFKTEQPINAVSYVKNGHVLNISGSDLDSEKIKDITFYQQGVTSATLEDEILPVKRSGNYLYFGDEPVVEGTEVEEDDNKEDNSTSSRPTGGGVGGGSGGGGGGGSAGGGAVTPKPQEPEVKDEPVVDEPVIDVPEVTEKEEYTDVATTDWYYGDVLALSEKGVVSGDGTGKFNPSDNVTREQFLKMLLVAMEKETNAGENIFADVADGAWYVPYVLTAKNLGIVNGVSDTQFGIGMNITRQDMAVMISRIIDTDADLAVEDFADMDDVSDYAANAVMHMKRIGLIDGYADGQFKPLNNLTRAEAAKVINSLIKIINK